MKRIFIAVTLPEAIRMELAKFIASNELLSLQEVKRTPAKNLHVTLQFFGEIAESLLPQIASALDQAAAKHKPFPLLINKTGIFGAYANPRVLWVGFEDDQEIQSLYREIAAGLKDKNLQCSQSSFSPHITLGRLNNKISPVEAQKVKNFCQCTRPPESLFFTADHVAVFESELKRPNPEYHILYEKYLA